jgi:hypothetical protein
MTKASWPASVEEILGGDQAVGLAHLTPAAGVVLTPVTNFALQNRTAGTMAFNSSVGMWHKLARIRDDPDVALAFHTREHGFSNRPEYVLVQGRASLPSLADPEAWQEAMGENWERFSGQPRDLGPLWGRWLSAYHQRVNVEIAVERLIVWPELACLGTPEIHGAPLPAREPAPQSPPARGSGPRVDHARAAKRLARLPNLLLGWVGADGFPLVVPVTVTGVGDEGIELSVPNRLIPAGGRRAGLLGHSFSRHVIGQQQRKHSGWLECDPATGQAVYAPHTEHGYRLPPSRLAFNLSAGFVARRGLRQARREGFLP